MLNTGGAFKTASCALGGIGGVFRNHYGDWILGFSGLLVTADALDTELHALHKGLQLALDHYLLPLEINVDAQLLVDLLYTDFTNISPLLLDCRCLRMILLSAMCTESRTN